MKRRRVIDLDVATESDGRVSGKFSSDGWEINVFGAPDELAALVAIDVASWDERTSIKAGTSAGKPVFWVRAAGNATMLVGDDDETWNIAITVPLALVRDLTQYAMTRNDD